MFFCGMELISFHDDGRDSKFFVFCWTCTLQQRGKW